MGVVAFHGGVQQGVVLDGEKTINVNLFSWSQISSGCPLIPAHHLQVGQVLFSGIQRGAFVRNGISLTAFRLVGSDGDVELRFRTRFLSIIITAIIIAVVIVANVLVHLRGGYLC